MDMTRITNQAEDFASVFCRATENPTPLPYQNRLALAEPLPTLLDVPTGLGKTAAAVLAWVWRRRFAEDVVRQKSPRRLVYCLPMRVLVEQTFTESVKWLHRLGLLAGPAAWTETDANGLPTKQATLQRGDGGAGRGYQADPGCAPLDDGKYPIAVHLLLGGEEKSDWALWPERDAILIGTQDMLLSRAMNRGYAAGRARWPLEFAFLNSDCLWVFDEIQIMDTGLASSLQFDAWRCSLRLRPARDQFPKDKTDHISRPCHSLWMSATMARHWLERAVDWSLRVDAEWNNRHQLQPADHENDRVKGLFANSKKLIRAELAPEGKKKKGTPIILSDNEREYLDLLAKFVIDSQAKDGLTLVIVNTVDRARKLFQLLPKETTKLIHSRFRPIEREGWTTFLRHEPGTPRIIVSTQVVEAGIDLSAKVLFTELAPWASLVQRFGRCARYPGENGTLYWMDIVADEQAALPYSVEELKAARDQLERMAYAGVGLQALNDRRSDIDTQATTLFPYEPRFVPRDKDLFDLFDTTPDLTGADVDISRFIRDGEELDVQVFWRELSDDQKPTKKDRPHRRELCAVPFHRFQKFARAALKQRHRIWRRRYSKGRNRKSSWEPVEFGSVDQVVYAGQVFLLEKLCGGYSAEFGWTGESQHTEFNLLTPNVQLNGQSAADDEDDADDLSQINAWLTVEEHTRHVCEKLEALLRLLGWTEADCSAEIKTYVKILRLAARLHDWGKAHAAFVAKLDAERLRDPQVMSKLAGQPAAKAPESAWKKNGTRPGFRHELASALAILEVLYRVMPTHDAFRWPPELEAEFKRVTPEPDTNLADDLLLKEIIALDADELDLLVYLVAAHHGKVRMSLRSSPDDEGAEGRQARGVRDDDEVPGCKIPDAVTPTVTLSLDPMELGLSLRYGASWRERTQLLLERLGPFQLGYLEALLRAADRRASKEEDECGKGRN